MKQNNLSITPSPRSKTFRRGAAAVVLGCLTLSGSLIIGGCAKDTEKDAKVGGVDKAVLTPSSLQERLSNIDKLSLPPEKKEELKQEARQHDATLKAQAAQYEGMTPKPAGGGDPSKPPGGYVVPPGAAK
jgi:hypothetical protein